MRLHSRLFYKCVLTIIPMISMPSMASHLTPGAPTSGKFFYYDSSRTKYAKFNDYYWIVGRVYPGHPLPEQLNGSISYEPTAVSLHNCSDKTLHCVMGLGSVFAVPRIGLALHSEYFASGSILKVEKCIQGNSTICQVALISSICRKDLSGGCVVPIALAGDNNGRGKYDGPTLYFIYNEDIGVTAYGESNKPELDLKTEISIASQYVLSGNIGLLGPDHMLPIRGRRE